MERKIFKSSDALSQMLFGIKTAKKMRQEFELSNIRAQK